MQIFLVLLCSQFAIVIKNFWFLVATAGSINKLDYIISNFTIFVMSFGTRFLAKQELANIVLLLIILNFTTYIVFHKIKFLAKQKLDNNISLLVI